MTRLLASIRHTSVSPLCGHSLALISTLALLTALGGCGGGGSADPTPAPPSTAVRENYALVDTSPPASYAAGSAAAGFYATLNTIRLGMGAGALTQSAALDKAAAAHLAYLQANYPNIGSTETAGNTGYVAASAAERATLSGYTARKVSEFIGSTTGTAATAQDCLSSLLENPYALNALAEPWRDVGIAYGVLKTAPPPAPASAASTPSTSTTLPAAACVLLVGIQAGRDGQLPDANALKTFPYDGQQNVALSFGPGPEGQQPAPDLQNKSAPPLQVSMANFGALSAAEFSVEAFTLRDGLGRDIPSRIIVSRATSMPLNLVYYRDPMYLLPASDAMLLPLLPLTSDTQYTAHFRGRNAGQLFDKTWSFTTRQAKLATAP